MSMIDQRTLLCYGNCITLIKHPTLETLCRPKKVRLRKGQHAHTLSCKKGLWKKAEID